MPTIIRLSALFLLITINYLLITLLPWYLRISGRMQCSTAAIQSRILEFTKYKGTASHIFLDKATLSGSLFRTRKNVCTYLL